MANEERRIVVFGATGQQGGAVARHLLRAGFPVRAITRSPDKPAARALGDAGAELVAADMREPASLEAACAGCHGLFSVQNFWERGVGYEGEVAQGRALADAAKAAGVAHFVQSSIAKGNAPDAKGPEHFRCKWVVEDHLRAIEQPFTAIRTVFFYDNFAVPYGGAMMFPVLTGGLDPDLKFHGMVVDDLGAMAAVVFADPDRYLGTHVDLASDVLTVAEMKATYTRTTGKKPWGFGVPRWLLRMTGEMNDQFAWNNEVRWDFDLETVREHLPHLTSFEDYCRANLT